MGITLGVAYRSKFGGDEGSSQFYHVDLLGVIIMATLCMILRILRTQNFDIHWDNSLDLR